MPLILLFYLIRIDKMSAQTGINMGQYGHPVYKLFPILICYDIRYMSTL